MFFIVVKVAIVKKQRPFSFKHRFVAGPHTTPLHNMRSAGRRAAPVYDVPSAGIGMYLTGEVVAEAAGKAPAPSVYLAPSSPSSETDTDGDLGAYSALHPQRTMYGDTLRRDQPLSTWPVDSGAVKARVLRLDEAASPTLAACPHRHSHRLLWALVVLIGAVAVAALAVALTRGGSAGNACSCDPTRAADTASAAAVAALQVNLSRHDARLEALERAGTAWASCRCSCLLTWVGAPQPCVPRTSRKHRRTLRSAKSTGVRRWC